MERTQRKQHRGIVVSTKQEKTIVVEVSTYKKHRLYGKRVKQTNKFHAHDENKEARNGDYVLIQATRPLSKKKHFRLIKIIARAEQLEDIDVSKVKVDEEMISPQEEGEV